MRGDSGQRVVVMERDAAMGEGKRLLWMDGEIGFLKAHILFLEDHGYKVDKARTADSSQVMLQQKRYDLVILDEQICGKEGVVSVLQQIKTQDPSVPVVLVTKNEEVRLVEAVWGRSFEGYLVKPVNPMQMLALCGEILRAKSVRGNQATSAYVRDISEIKSNLLAHPTPSKWVKVYFQLCKWDVELHSLPSPSRSLEETHRGHKRELARRFISYVENHYVEWAGKKGGNPELHTRTVQRKLVPLLKQGANCALMVMGGMRFGQWLHVQKMLEPLFRVENNAAWALLPTEGLFCRAALFSGRMPRDINLDQPQLWNRLREDDDTSSCQRELLRFQLRQQGIDLDDIRVLHVKTPKDAKRLSSDLTKNADARLVVIVIEFMDLLDLQRRDHPLESSPKEGQVRVLAGEWFQDSGMMDAMRTLAESKRSVVFTSDHGTVRVDSPAEVFCQEEKSPHPRVKIGPNISCDERQALFVESPPQYGLPGEPGELAYAIAKENFYFVYPNKFQYFVTQYKNQMVSGGLSMEEVIVPLATLTPK